MKKIKFIYTHFNMNNTTVYSIFEKIIISTLAPMQFSKSVTVLFINFLLEYSSITFLYRFLFFKFL